VRFEQPANQFIFDRHWMDKPAKLGNRTTYAAVVKLCDELLADLSLRTGVAGKIRASLLQDIATRPTFAATAKQLGTTTRTLRRQLQQQGTSCPGGRENLLATRRIFATPSGAGPARPPVSFGAAPAGRFDFLKAQPTEPIERRLLHEAEEGFDEADQRFRGIQQEASHAADQSAVEADKLKVASDIALDQIDQLSCVPSLDLVGDETRHPALMLGDEAARYIDDVAIDLIPHGRIGS
jgi:hypothetical protein